MFRCNSSVVARGLADSARADAAAGACGLARADANFAAAARDNVARARDIAEAANAYELWRAEWTGCPAPLFLHGMLQRAAHAARSVARTGERPAIRLTGSDLGKPAGGRGDRAPTTVRRRICN
ncbi:hypothetical protein IFM12276_36750 [Nocardia sputorum]|uniref:Uncharacterized protein n=1 Tax=Nocardia sputorum TaxID=2984338 RepID=A0ABM8D003_9NOCA|nr:hypothetical protein IFM12276_36750 [Nocardia sputorum]